MLFLLLFTDGLFSFWCLITSENLEDIFKKVSVEKNQGLGRCSLSPKRILVFDTSNLESP